MRSTLSLSFILALILFGIAGYNGYTKYQQLSTVKQNIASADLLKNKLIQEDYPDSEGAIQDAKEAKSALVFNTELKKLFPPLAFKTALYKEFEEYFICLNGDETPMVVNTINIPEPVNDKDLGAGVIKIMLNIESSEANFYKFMDWIEHSGNLTNKTENKKPVDSSKTTEKCEEKPAPRLMSIESIQIQMPDKSKESEEEIEKAAPPQWQTETTESEPAKVPTFQYNVTLNTYVQLQPEGNS